MARDSDEARANRLASMSRAAAPSAPASSDARQFEGRTRSRGAAVLRVDRIVPDPDQPRTEFDEEALEQLAASLKARGQLQPIRVRWDDSADRYVIVVGERRWRAAGIAGLETLEVVVVEGTASPDELLEDQLVENALRADLKPVEQGRAYERLMKAGGLSQRALADRLNVSQASVAKAVALLNLPDEIQESVDAGVIGPDVGYQLSKVADPREQAELAAGAAQGRVKRDRLAQAGKGRGAIAARPARPDPVVLDLGDGTTVRVAWTKANGVGALQALRRAVKHLQAQERGEGEAA